MPLCRPPISPTPENGIKRESQLTIDKIVAIKREKIGKRVDRLRPADMQAVNEALRLWLSR
jgi:mRNA interferase MazF